MQPIDIKDINLHTEIKRFTEVAKHYPHQGKIGIPLKHLYTYIKRGVFTPQIIEFLGKKYIYIPESSQKRKDWGLKKLIHKRKPGPKPGKRKVLPEPLKPVEHTEITVLQQTVTQIAVIPAIEPIITSPEPQPEITTIPQESNTSIFDDLFN